MMFQQPSDDICMMMKFLSNAPIIYLSANTCASLQLQAVITISSKHEFTVNKYFQLATQATTMTNNNPLVVNEQATLNAHQPNNTTHPTSNQVLPIQMDQLLTYSMALNRRQLGENFDERLQLTVNNFLVTFDNKYILASGFWDKSFRVFSTENGRVVQIIYGHYDIVTCVSRSEMTHNGNCFVATGSRDSTIMIWIWNGQKGYIVNKDLTLPSTNENPAPGAILTGHSTELVAVMVSSELGIVVSASKYGTVLVHTVYGDLLRQFEQYEFDANLKFEPSLVIMSQDAEHVCVLFEKNTMCVYTINGKQLYTRKIDDHINSIVMSQDSQYVIIGGDKGIVYVYKLHDLALLYTFPMCDSSIRSLTLTFDQK
jgi:WD40 repeat protein